MPALISEESYQFTPPRDSRFWPKALQWWLPRYLRRKYLLEDVQLTGAEKIRKALDEKSGVMVAPNHCRPCDPLALSVLSSKIRSPLNIMASAHLFRGKIMRYLLPRAGAFSMNREGLDRESLKTAVRILTEAQRTLIVFPEGVITRTNDRVLHLQDGVSFMARSAAKARADDGGKVLIFPLAMRYLHTDNWEKGVSHGLTALENRLGWKKSPTSLTERMIRAGHGVLALKEVEFFGAVQSGSIEERLNRFVDNVLCPLETKYLGDTRQDPVVMRVKLLRKAILPILQSASISTEQREALWRELMDLEVAQQASHFPPDYIVQNPSPERLIETLERYQEALGDPDPPPPCPLRLHMTVLDPLTVSSQREKGVADDLMPDLRRALQEALLKA